MDEHSYNKFTMTVNSDNMIEIEKTPVNDGMTPWGHSDYGFLIQNKMTEKTDRRYKDSEDSILKELSDYISGTYNQHYSAGDDKIQTLDLIEACGDGEAFCRSNIL